jgi:hypothetical protein
VRVKLDRYLHLKSLNGIPVAILMMALVAFYLAVVYGVVGVIRARRALLAHAFGIGAALYVLVASAGPEAFGGRGERFRAPVMPILALYAAHGAMELWASRRRDAVAVPGQSKARPDVNPQQPAPLEGAR